MTTGARRLMRLSVAVPKEGSANGHLLVSPSCLIVLSRRKVLCPIGQRVSLDQEGSLFGLSRMKGNFQVRFLEGGGLATARFHSV